METLPPCFVWFVRWGFLSLEVVSALRHVPKPGYGLKAATLPAAGRNGGPAGMFVSDSGLLACPSFCSSSFLSLMFFYLSRLLLILHLHVNIPVEDPLRSPLFMENMIFKFHKEKLRLADFVSPIRLPKFGRGSSARDAIDFSFALFSLEQPRVPFLFIFCWEVGMMRAFVSFVTLHFGVVFTSEFFSSKSINQTETAAPHQFWNRICTSSVEAKLS